MNKVPFTDQESAAIMRTFNVYKYERERISSWKQTKLMNLWNIRKTFSASLVEERLGLERNTEREGNLSNVPKGNFVSAEVKLEK